MCGSGNQIGCPILALRYTPPRPFRLQLAAWQPQSKFTCQSSSGRLGADMPQLIRDDFSTTDVDDARFKFWLADHSGVNDEKERFTGLNRT
jgi:hypothetical protein